MLRHAATLPQRRLYAASNCRAISRPLISASASAPPQSSAFTGVSRAKTASKWQATITHGGKQIHLGLYVSEEEAARTWDKAAVLSRPHDDIKLNFPRQDYLDARGRTLLDPRIEALLQGDHDNPALAGRTKAGKQLASAFRGVSRMRNKWQAEISHGGKKFSLGMYDSEEEAARTWDKAAVRIRPHDGIKLNFPLQDYLDAQDKPLPDPRIEALLRGNPVAGMTKSGKQLTSAFTGVSRYRQKWRASIIHGGKLVHLGYYDSEEEAARTWDKAAVLSRPHDGELKLNFPLQDYLDAQEEKPLPEPRIEALLRGDPVDPALAGKTKAGKQVTSAFTGVSRKGNKWLARIVHCGKLVQLGSYDSEEEAARTWDKAAVLSRPHDGIKLNFPLQDYLDVQDKPLPDPRVEALLRGDLDDPALAGITKSGKQLASALRGVRRKGKQLTSAALKQ